MPAHGSGLGVDVGKGVRLGVGVEVLAGIIVGDEVGDGDGKIVGVRVGEDVLVKPVVGVKVTVGVKVSVLVEGGVRVEVGCIGSFPVIGIVSVSVPSITGGSGVFVRTLSRPNAIARTSVGVISTCSTPSSTSVNTDGLSFAANATFKAVSPVIRRVSPGSEKLFVGLPIEPGKPRLSAVIRFDNSSRIPQTANGLASMISKRKRRSGALTAHLCRCSGMRCPWAVAGVCRVISEDFS